jgi:putative endonuclease
LKLNSPKQKLGALAESMAEKKLLSEGLTLITRNFQDCGGEVDLIMRDREYYVFVEVRERCHPEYGNAIETVTYPKQRKIIKAAKAFLQQNQLWDRVYCRFDVVGINFNSSEEFVWIKNAFGLRGF